MTILQSLAGYYDRMAANGEAEPPGFSREKISFAVVIDAAGGVIAVTDLRDATGKKPVATLRDVPSAQKRTVAVVPNFLWDKTAYSLGVTAAEGKRTAQEHQAFRDLHAKVLDGHEDEGLAALGRFLANWSPEHFIAPHFSSDMLDVNIVFRLDGDTGDDGKPRFIHDRPAALPLIEARAGEGESAFCLISGVETPIARLHPSIKGVDGAQTMGAALVSFNLDAFESYGKTQGANAPTGQAAAVRYGAALNRLLDRGSRNRIRIGDATVAFWADTSISGEVMARRAEEMLFGLFGNARADTDLDASETEKLRNQLKQLAEGNPVTIGTDAFHPQTRIHILGLSPNAARLSVRFWLTQDLGTLAANLARHEADCRVEPLPWHTPPSINRLLVKTTAAQEKWDNIPPQLAGEMARAVLSGGRYPRTLLATAIMRLRAGDDPGGGWHAAAIRAVLARERTLIRADGIQYEEEWLMSLTRDHPNVGYQLGRLFAAYEIVQRGALGKVNATIRDKYFGAASAAPARIFPLIARSAQIHLSKIRKNKPGFAKILEDELDQIMNRIAPDIPRSVPRLLRLEDQGEFVLGYYHQRHAKLGDKSWMIEEADEGDTTDD